MGTDVLKKIAESKYLSYWVVYAMDVVISALSALLSALIVSYMSRVSLAVGQVGYAVICDVALCVGVLFLFGTYRSVIRHSSFREIWRIGFAVLVKVVLLAGVLYLWPLFGRNQSAIFLLLDGLITIIALIGVRALMITFYDAIVLRFSSSAARVLVYGVSEKSLALETRMRNSPHFRVVGFLHNGKGLKFYRMSGLPVMYFTSYEDFADVVNANRITGVIFPNYIAAQHERDGLVSYCEPLGVKLLVAPPVDEFDENMMSKQFVREVKIEDLLGRDEIKINTDEITANVKGKVVMVTGAAGSIGSELCRQLAKFGVGQLVLFDNAETPMHYLRLELETKFPNLKFTPFIGDVRMRKRLEVAFRRYSPQIVFHAAAYKHVPLMEENPCEAVYVNVVGTRNLADLCVAYGTQKMVMVSTDKAVNPTNVMGASKRLAEIYVQSLGNAIREGKVKGDTKFITTRFGNVLGSNGSVIPRFREQIANGGPLTVTHPDIMRFFMTIPEACRLVMEAATMPVENNICVFDMGEAVNISDLAKRMIKLAGLRPDIDIKIKYTGLRPGEKLYEEVLSNEENTVPTAHGKIRVAKVREYCYDDLLPVYDEFYKLATSVCVNDTVRLMKQTVPEFKSQNSPFEALDHELEQSEQTQTA